MASRTKKTIKKNDRNEFKLSPRMVKAMVKSWITSNLNGYSDHNTFIEDFEMDEEGALTITFGKPIDDGDEEEDEDEDD